MFAPLSYLSIFVSSTAYVHDGGKQGVVKGVRKFHLAVHDVIIRPTFARI
jgi:hypothetical protein